MKKSFAPVRDFLKKHWIDGIVVAAVVVLLAFGALAIAERFNFATKWQMFTDYFVANRGYKDLLIGMKNTGIIAGLGMLIGMVIGTFIAIIRVIPSYSRIARYAQSVCSVYVGFFRGTPIVVQLLIGYFILWPMFGLSVTAITSCVIIFGLNSGAYISEIMRGGINSVDGGQLEAARAVGLPFSTSMVRIVVPQAVKNILPTLGNEFITLIKETAIVGYVGAMDITKYFQDQGSTSYEFMIPYLVMAALYIVIVAVIAYFVKLMERRLKKSER